MVFQDAVFPVWVDSHTAIYIRIGKSYQDKHYLKSVTKKLLNLPWLSSELKNLYRINISDMNSDPCIDFVSTVKETKPASHNFFHINKHLLFSILGQRTYNTD